MLCVLHYGKDIYMRHNIPLYMFSARVKIKLKKIVIEDKIIFIK